MNTPSPKEREPAVAVLPYGIRSGTKLASHFLKDLDWPMGWPEKLLGAQVGDLGDGDHLIAYPSTAVWIAPRPGVKANLSVMIVEPRALHASHMRLARVLYRRLWRVLSCNAELLDKIPNGIFFPFGSTWVPDWQQLDLSKSRNLSLIASAKRDLPGHVLRHRVADWLKARNVAADVMGRGFAPFDKKSDGLAPYRYSIVIENVREPAFFTEKLIDAMLCMTVPIYWGAPDIARFFDPHGLMICDSFEAVQAAVARATPEDYAARFEALRANQMRAAGYANLHERAARAVLESCQ